jgi:hypothetical protein
MAKTPGSSCTSHDLSDPVCLQSSVIARDSSDDLNRPSTPPPLQVNSPSLLSPDPTASPCLSYAPFDIASDDRLSFDAKDDDIEGVRLQLRSAVLSNTFTGEAEPLATRSVMHRPLGRKRLPVVFPSCPNIPELAEAPALDLQPQAATSVEARHSAPGAPEAARIATLPGAVMPSSRLSAEAAAAIAAVEGEPKDMRASLATMVPLPSSINMSQLFAPSGWSPQGLPPPLADTAAATASPVNRRSQASSGGLHLPWPRMSMDGNWWVRHRFRPR